MHSEPVYIVEFLDEDKNFLEFNCNSIVCFENVCFHPIRRISILIIHIYTELVEEYEKKREKNRNIHSWLCTDT